jgi:hypothetical protein
MTTNRCPTEAGLDNGVLWIEIIISSWRSSHARLPCRDSKKMKTR